MNYGHRSQALDRPAGSLYLAWAERLLNVDYGSRGIQFFKQIFFCISNLTKQEFPQTDSQPRQLVDTFRFSSSFGYLLFVQASEERAKSEKIRHVPTFEKCNNF